jgi:PAS domain S-box-containing protein
VSDGFGEREEPQARAGDVDLEAKGSRRMAELEEANRELRELKSELESRVQARTADLQIANEQLRQEAMRRRLSEDAVRENEEHLRRVELRMVQGQLAQQQQIFDRFFNLSLDLLVIATVDGYFRRVNPAFDVLGYTEAELTTRPFIDLVHPDDVPVTLAATASLARGEPARGFENRYRKKDGSYVWLSWVVAPDSTGTLYAVARDISESKRVMAELREAKQVAETASAELEAFSYSVAHDLRAPLRGISGFAQAMVEDYGGRIDAQADDYLRRITTGSQRMGHLIDALLGLARVTRTELRRVPVDLVEIASSVVAGLRQAEPERQVDFVALEQRIPMLADPSLLRVALDNLVGNAWKFTARRSPARIEIGVAQKDGEPVCFVRDDGAGFDMAYAARLFTPFQRLHDPTEFAGTGIGLATVQRIVHRHGGRVWAESAVGAGASFYFTIPRVAGVSP